MRATAAQRSAWPQPVPTELVIYPGQNHGLKKPSYIIDRSKRYLDWYAKWITAPKPVAP